MSSNENLVVNKLIYQAQICESLKNLEDCYKYIEESIKLKKEEISNFQVLLFEDSAKNVLEKKIKKILYTESLEEEDNSKDSKMIYVLKDILVESKKEVIEFCDKIVKFIDSVMLKKPHLKEFHKYYYGKLKADFILHHHLIEDNQVKESLNLNKEINSSGNFNTQNLSKNRNTDYLLQAYGFYKSSYDEYEKQNLFLPGCILSTRLICSYCYFINKYKNISMNDKNDPLNILETYKEKMNKLILNIKNGVYREDEYNEKDYKSIINQTNLINQYVNLVSN